MFVFWAFEDKNDYIVKQIQNWFLKIYFLKLKESQSFTITTIYYYNLKKKSFQACNSGLFFI